MASITLRATHVCSGGEHVTLSVEFAGLTVTLNTEASDMLTPITQEDLLAWARVTLRIYKAGKTMAQVRNAMQSGLTVSV